MILVIAAVVVIGYKIIVEGIGGPTATNAAVQRISQAIAYAEGFYIAGSRASRNHNPGDMTADLIGRKVGMDGSFVVYSNDEDGWANLYKQVGEWLDGSSAHADSSSTIADISGFYTTTDQTAWATNVANQLGVGIDTPIGEVS